MNKKHILTGFMIAGLATLPLTVMAKDGKDDAVMERSKTMTQERAMQHDHMADHDAMMDRDRTRDQLRDGTGDGEPDQDRDRDRLQDGSHIYGSVLMTEEEKLRFREQIRNAKSEEERLKLMKQHRVSMQERARQQGVELADEE